VVCKSVTTYAQEKFSDARPEIEALTAEHWDEMAVGFEGIAVQPMWDLWLTAELQNALVGVTARQEGLLIGYFGFILHPFPSAKNVKAATSTPYFIAKVRHRGIVLRRLVKEAVALAKGRGAQMITIRNHPSASAGPILENLGFHVADVWYMLNLAKELEHA